MENTVYSSWKTQYIAHRKQSLYKHISTAYTCIMYVIVCTS